MATRPEYPHDVAINTTAVIQNSVIGSVSCLICDTDAACDAMSERLIEASLSAFDAVRGNRAESQPMTWSDLRYAMAATLRLCLEELEKGEAG